MRPLKGNMNSLKHAVLFVLVVLVASITLAQSKVDQGKPGVQGPWSVTAPIPVFPADGGTPSNIFKVADFPYICGTNLETVVVMDGGCLTIGTLNPRLYIVAINSKDNTSGNVRCRNDGTCPTLTVGSPGQVLGVGDGVPFANSYGQPVKCIGVSNYVTVSECGP